MALLALASAAAAQPAEMRVPAALDGIDIVPRLGARVPLDASFRDEAGADVTLGRLVNGRPALLVFAYYRCPMLCPLVLNGVVRALRPLSLDAGADFVVVVVSVDPREGPAEAAEANATHTSAYRREGGDDGWHFLTGRQASIDAVASAAGFRYRYDERSQQYVHAAGIAVLTPDGRVARYLYGLEYAPRDVRLALVEASAGRIGSAVDRVLLYCFAYDPATGRYSLAILSVLRIAGLLTAAGLGGFVFFAVRQERARRARPSDRGPSLSGGAADLR